MYFFAYSEQKHNFVCQFLHILLIGYSEFNLELKEYLVKIFGKFKPNMVDKEI